MLTLLPHFPRKCCGLLWKTLTNTKRIHTIQAHCQQAKASQHYLRSPYSIIHHYYKDSGTLREAKSFVANFPKLSSIPLSQLDNILRLMKNDGHSWKEVELFKPVLLLSPVKYKHRAQLLQCLSISQPSLYHILWMVSLMNSTPIKSFRDGSQNIFNSDPVECLVSAGRSELNLPETTLQGARDLSTKDDQVTLTQVLCYMIKHYLAFRFSEDIDVVGSFLDSASIAQFWKPFSLYPEICDVLIHCLQLSFSDVKKQPQLLHIDSKNTREIVDKFSSIGDTPTREVAMAHPKMLHLPVSHLDRWLRLLHKHQVVQFKYTRQATSLFKTSSFSQIDKRLHTLKRLQEWEIIVSSNNLFEILSSQELIKRLLNTAESGQVINTLYSAIRPKNGPRQHARYKVTPEVVSYVSSTLGLPLEETRELLVEDVYTPYGIANTRRVLWLLLNYGFTREQVVAGAVVLNLEAGVVEQTLKDLHTRPEVQPFTEWMENPFVLHLLTYCIRKDDPHMQSFEILKNRKKQAQSSQE